MYSHSTDKNILHGYAYLNEHNTYCGFVTEKETKTYMTITGNKMPRLWQVHAVGCRADFKGNKVELQVLTYF